MDKNKKRARFLLLMILTALLVSDATEVRPSTNPAMAGQAVTLSLFPSVTFKSGTWMVGETLIVNWQGTQQAVFPGHTGRASVNVTTGALTLTSLNMTDSGVYKVQSFDPMLTANVSITVEEPILNVTVTVNQSGLIELESSALMTCSVSSGSSLSFFWVNDSSRVTVNDRIQLANGNTTLRILNLTQYDAGPFRCHVSNPVSNGTSNATYISVSYGPNNMTLTVNGGNTGSISAGSNVTMLCSAASNPPAQLQWVAKGELLNTTGVRLELLGVTENNSGSYSCLAFNNHTNKRSNTTTQITILRSGAEQLGRNVALHPLVLLFSLLSQLWSRFTLLSLKT